MALVAGSAPAVPTTLAPLPRWLASPNPAVWSAAGTAPPAASPP